MSKLVQIQHDMNCYNSYDSQTCLNLFRINMIRIDMILKHVKTWNQNMMKYSKIWANGTKKVSDDDYKVIPSSKPSDQKCWQTNFRFAVTIFVVLRVNITRKQPGSRRNIIPRTAVPSPRSKICQVVLADTKLIRI